MVIFVGYHASMALCARRHAENHALKAFATVTQLRNFLRGYLRSDDLVLLKGSDKADFLEQIVHHWNQGPDHRRSLNQNGLLNNSDSVDSRGRFVPESQENEHGPKAVANACATQIIVGLGNPGRKYQGTPHNVGQKALDLLAEKLQATWLQGESGMQAHAQFQSQHLLLLKSATEMNGTGPLLARMAQRLGFSPEQVVLIQDDINLDLGVVRKHMNGSRRRTPRSAIAHRGVSK